jgi:hypothetical protein
MPVDLLFDSGQTYGGRAYRDCIASAHAHHVPIVIAQRGMQWSSCDGVRLDILAPSLPFLADTGDDVNENSIVAMPNYNGFREVQQDVGNYDREIALFRRQLTGKHRRNLLAYGDHYGAAAIGAINARARTLERLYGGWCRMTERIM